MLCRSERDSTTTMHARVSHDSDDSDSSAYEPAPPPRQPPAWFTSMVARTIEARKRESELLDVILVRPGHHRLPPSVAATPASPTHGCDSNPAGAKTPGASPARAPTKRGVKRASRQAAHDDDNDDEDDDGLASSRKRARRQDRGASSVNGTPGSASGLTAAHGKDGVSVWRRGQMRG